MSSEKWQCSIHNGTLCLIKYELDMFIILKTDYFQTRFLHKSDLHIFYVGKFLKNDQDSTLLNLEKRQYLPHNWSDKISTFKGIANWAYNLLMKGHLKIRVMPL